jgi:hypothetical protein
MLENISSIYVEELQHNSFQPTATLFQNLLPSSVDRTNQILIQ